MSLATIYLNQSGTLAAKGTPGADGEPSYGAPASIKCRVEPLSEWKRAQLANSSKATAKVSLEPDSAANKGDRIVVGSTTYTVLSLEDRVDLDGDTIIRVATVSEK